MSLFTNTSTISFLRQKRRHNRIKAKDSTSITDTVLEDISCHSNLFSETANFKPEARLYMESYARTVEMIVEYFREMHKEHTQKYGTEKAKTTPCVIVCTPFHAALVRADHNLISDVMNKISDADVHKFAVNAMVLYNKESSFNCGEIFKARIAHLPEKHKHTFLKLEDEVKLKGTSYKHPYPNLHMQLPLALAALSGDFYIVQMMLSYGADLYATDSNGNNIIHNLVHIAMEHPTLAVQMFKEFKEIVTGVENKQKLGMAVNKDGLKPLDLAAHIGAVPITMPLVRWDGVYRFSLKECGPFQHVLYDVSDYELGNRMHILQYLALCPEIDLHKIDECDMLTTEPLKTWVHAMNETHATQARAWAFSWVLFIFFYFVQCAYYFSSGGEHPPEWLVIGLAIFAAVEICTETYSFFRDWSIYKLMREVKKIKGHPIAFTPVYRIFQGLFCVFLIATELLLLFDFDCKESHMIFSVMNVFNILWAFCSMLIFIQLNKATGHLLIVMESMVSQAGLFLSVGGVIFCIFPLCLHILHTEPACLMANSSTTETVGEDEIMFSSVAKSFYETLLLALGIAAPNPLYFDDSIIPELAMLAYIACVFIVGIVMMNLLIAIMTDRVSELNRHKHTIQAIQRLSLSLLLNRSVSSSLIRFLSPFSFIQNRIRRRYFVESADKTQVFLHVIEMVSSKNAAYENAS